MLLSHNELRPEVGLRVKFHFWQITYFAANLACVNCFMGHDKIYGFNNSRCGR